MRKYFIVLLAVLAAVCGIFGLAACDEHEHQWSDWEVVQPATCTAEGTQKRVCTECDEEEFAALEKVAHTYSAGWVSVRAATCTEEGEEQNVCDVCHQGQTRSVATIPHTFGDWYELEPASCSAFGLQRHDCIICNPLAEDDKAYETAPIEKLAHTPREQEEIPANCLVAGREEGTDCSVCGAIISGMEEIPALGHWMGTPQVISESTCTTPGIEETKCQRAGCEHSVRTELELKPHTRVAIGDARNATCYADGITAGSWCSECKEVFEQQQTIPALTHLIDYRFGTAGDEATEQAGTHIKYCTRPECNFEEEEPCSLDSVITSATCTKAEHHVHTCEYCDHSYEHDEGDPLGHNFGGWFFDIDAYDASLRDRDGAATVVRQHRRVCANPEHVPDPEEPDVLPCDNAVDGEPVAPNCTTAGYTNYKCGTCNATYTGDKQSALGHQWKTNADGSRKYTTILYHGIYVHYFTCDRCEANSTYYSCRYETSTWEAANCEHGKTLVYTCSDCKQEHRVEKSEPLGHAYGGWIHDADTAGGTSKHYRICGRDGCGDRDEADCVMQSSNRVPTCQAPGREIQICKDCRYTEEGDEIGMLEHDVTGQPYVPERALKSHYQECKRCRTKVYTECPYNEQVTGMSCTTDETTTYTCPTCRDSYTVVTARTTGHVVTRYTDSDLLSHTGQCDRCQENVSVPHDFSESNICKVCNKDGLYYTFVGGESGPKTEAVVTRLVSDGRYVSINTPKVVIPEMVNIDGHGDVPVVAIGQSAFFQNPYIEEVVLPKNLTMIDYYAFMGCAKLARVSISGHNVGETGIDDCKLNRIDSGAFRDCTSLTNAILPETLQYIGQEAFRGCTQLAEINIPALVTEIQDHAFTDTAYFTDPAHWVGDVLYIGPHLVRAKTSLAGSYVVQDGTVSISAEAFMDCAELTHITLPAELVAVDKDAFKGCLALDTVVFKGTFANYLAIRFDNDMASPMHFAKNLTISGAEGTPQIPAETTVIPAGAFRGSQIESIVIPASVTSVGANAFADCAQLTSVKFANGSKLISVGADIVSNTPFYREAGNWEHGLLYVKDESGSPVALVAAKESELDAYAPYGGEGFGGSAKQAIVAEGTLSVAARLFAGFETLRYVEIPDTVIYLGAGLFEGCTGLNRVNFREGTEGWFAYGDKLGRLLSGAYLYGGADGTDYANQRKVAEQFKLYNLQWKRNNYGS